MRLDKGFSLVETITVIALVLALAGTGYVATISLLRWQSLLNNTNLISSQIVLAQVESYTQVDDASHGVHIADQTVTRFTGDSYLLRDIQKDVTSSLPSTIIASGDTEIVFENGGLVPTQSILLILQIDDRSYDITLSSYGMLQVTAGSSES